jgi:hypothetical protein
MKVTFSLSTCTSAAPHSSLGWLFKLQVTKPEEVRRGLNLDGLRLRPALTN